VTAVVGARRLVSASELQRAWRAVQAGQFKEASSGDKPFKPVEPSARPLWRPGEGEHVLPVVGCAGSLGASTTALGLACAAEGPTRILECCSGTASGLVAASTLELGVHRSGWNRGTRGSVVVERASDLLPSVAYVPSLRFRISRSY